MLAATLKKMDPSALAQALGANPTKRSALEGETHNFAGSIKKKARVLGFSNEYKGFQIPSHKFTIPTITLDEESLTPKKFYEIYVSQRRPVVIRGSLRDLEGIEKFKSDNEYLKKQAGRENVVVEIRSNNQDTFGRGNQVSMHFSKFLDLVDEGDEMHYLTTQNVEADEGGRPDLMAPFMKALEEQFPLRPNLMGNLVPSNM